MLDAQVAAAMLFNASLPATVTPLQRFYRLAGVEAPSHCTSPSSSSSSRILFVVTAHLPNRNNCALLWSTLHSLACFHPDERVLLVDNDSPFDNVRRVVESASRPALRLERHAPSSDGTLT